MLVPRQPCGNCWGWNHLGPRQGRLSLKKTEQTLRSRGLFCFEHTSRSRIAGCLEFIWTEGPGVSTGLPPSTWQTKNSFFVWEITPSTLPCWSFVLRRHLKATADLLRRSCLRPRSALLSLSLSFLICKVGTISPCLSESGRFVQFKWAHGDDSTWRGALLIMNSTHRSCSSLGCRPSPASLAHSLPLWKQEENYQF